MNIADKETIREYLHKKKAKVLDVRRDDEFATKRVGHGCDVFHFPIAKLEQSREAVESKLNKNDPIVVHCAAGKRAAAAIDQMTKWGYTDLINGGGVDTVDAIAENQGKE